VGRDEAVGLLVEGGGGGEGRKGWREVSRCGVESGGKHRGALQAHKTEKQGAGSLEDSASRSPFVSIFSFLLFRYAKMLN
jgi:hypothetical protein